MNEERTAKLQLVLGTTCSNPNGLQVAEQTNTVVTVAGSTILVRNLDNKKSGYILGDPDHPFTCVAISSCGNYVASGEFGSEPAIRVYEINFIKNHLQYTIIQRQRCHTTEVVAVKFVPNTSLIVSVGCEEDGHVALWNFRTSKIVATAKVTALVYALAVSSDGSFFVTMGTKHIKYWIIPTNSESESIQSRTAILADKRSSTFVDCAIVDSNRTLAITSEGEIVELIKKKYSKSYKFERLKPVAITSRGNSILIGCSDGSIQFCSSIDLSLINNLPLPAPLNADPSEFTKKEDLEVIHSDSSYPSVVAIGFSHGGEGVVCIYSDKSFYAYVPHGNHWQKLESHLSHSSNINHVMAVSSPNQFLPSDAIITAASDFSIRIWSFDSQLTEGTNFSNLLSPNLIKLIRLSDARAESPNHLSGVTSLKISPDFLHLMAGSSVGNLHVFDLQQPDFPLLETIDAHNGCVTCMDYSNFRGFPTLFASGGGDRLVHLFRQTEENYKHCGTIENHEGMLTGIKFAESNGTYRLYSSSKDRILVWLVIYTENSIDFAREQLITCSSSVNVLNVWQSRNLLLASCADWSIRGYDVSGKPLLSLSVPVDNKIRNQHILTTLEIDPSQTFAVVASTSGACYMLDLRSGSIVATLNPTGLVPVRACFSEDCKRVIVVSASGCMFAWRLASPIVNQMVIGRRSMMEIAPRTPTPDSLLGSGSEALSEELYSLSIGDKLSDFGSTSSLDQSANGPTIVLSPGNSKSLSLSVQEAQVTRRSNSNLLASTNDLSNDIDDTQSDFISRQRNVPQYQSSKSMLNLREGGGYGGLDSLSPNVMNRQLPRKIRPSWDVGINLEPKYDQGYPENNNTMPPYKQPEQIPTTIMDYNSYRTSVDSPPQQRILPKYNRGNTELLSRSHNLALPTYPKQNMLSYASPNHSPVSGKPIDFGRNDDLRISLSKKHFESITEPKSLWGSHSMTPKRTTSSLQAQTSPSGGAASAISRRPDDYTTSQLHLRSRSQSPNHFKLSQAATPTSREITKSRRDSDMSYTAMSSRMTPASSRTNLRDSEMRKSTDALNKLSALRSKMHQSSENLLRSTDNLMLTPSDSTHSGHIRTQSSSNLKGPQLEMAGSFDPDRTSTPASRSLLNSRILARSMGNVNDQNDPNVALSARLTSTVAKIKKASNPDLTNESLYEELDSPSSEKMRKRGAVQKRVERYHPRNRTNRPQTSEESDSNNSDAPLGYGDRRILNSAQRSISSVESSPRFMPGLQNRRLYEQQQRSPNPVAARRPNYLTKKLAGNDLNSSGMDCEENNKSLNKSLDMQSLLDEVPGCQQLVRHVEECCDQINVQVDKMVYARRMVESSTLTKDQKRIIHDHLNRVTERSIEKLQNAYRTARDASNGNDYTPMKAAEGIYDV